MTGGFTQEWLDEQVALGRVRVIEPAREAATESQAKVRDEVAPVAKRTRNSGLRGGKRQAGAEAGAAERTSRASICRPMEGGRHLISGVTGGERPAPIQRPEQGLQITVAAFLDWALPEDYRWLHIPNGEKRNPVIAAILKAMGVKPGAADVLILCPNGRFIWIELKSTKGRLSTDQASWRDWCHAIGAPWFLCRSLDDVVAACEDAGVPLLGRAA